MNSTQTVALLTSLIVGMSSAAVAKIGISPEQWQSDVKDLLGLAVAVGAVIVAHKHHATATTPSTPVTTVNTVTK
jgi:hypothetical protein